jgi:protocatechuate 3,4-dioxygenase beta subunit
LSDAAVEIWHADAAGVYSGVPGNSGNFLRGVQRTNASGVARFDTISRAGIASRRRAVGGAGPESGKLVVNAY